MPFEHSTAIVARWVASSNPSTASRSILTGRGGAVTVSPARIRAYERRPSILTADAAGTAWITSPVMPAAAAMTASASVGAPVGSSAPSGSSVVDEAPNWTTAS